jgi:hypothetical protein
MMKSIIAVTALMLPSLALAQPLPQPKPGAQIATRASEVPQSDQFGELFRNVQLKRIFPDSKTFADLHSDESPNAILADYEARKVESGFDLRAFVHQHFSLPLEGPTVTPRRQANRQQFRRAVQHGVCPICGDRSASHRRCGRGVAPLRHQHTRDERSRVLAEGQGLRPDVPVIMITAYGDAATKRKALENGAEALLTKPIDFTVLRSGNRYPDRKSGMTTCAFS